MKRNRRALLLSAVAAMAMAGAGTAAGAPTARRIDAIELDRIDILFSLSRRPDDITASNIDRLFDARLQAYPCDDQAWHCQWITGSKDEFPALTHVLLPNPRSRKFTTGGDIVLEIAPDSCIALEDVAGRLQAIPQAPSRPPTYLSFSPGDEEPELMRIFDDIPGMDKQVSIIAWMRKGCLARLNVRALISPDMR